MRSRMIVFRTEKELSHFAVEAPRVTLSFSARCAVGIPISALQYSEKSLVVVGFVFSSPINFANVRLSNIKFCFHTCAVNQIQKRLHHLYIQKVAILKLKSRDSSIWFCISIAKTHVYFVDDKLQCTIK